MPRRTTLTYSSKDAPDVRSEQIYVYYCKFSGRHALTTNCDLRRAPRRRTDGSSVIDTQVYTAKLYTSDGGAKLIRRPEGHIEKQYRQNLGKLPIAYRSEPGGRFLYILSGALTTYSIEESQAGVEKAPVPPCILPVEDGTSQVSLEVDDRADRPTILKISADHVRIQIKSGISSEGAGEEILEFVRAVLGVRLSQLSLLRGESTRHKLLLVKGVLPAKLFDQLQAFMARARD
ncbi:hypothetical protein WJX81_004753 [Elliptochloris bilobata]|uniref:STEEP1 domain-containing protein n=1 Tax=Elliptochloris bilobata TaxID=381761 RepID=A0AAW1QW68_9CHLO